MFVSKEFSARMLRISTVLFLASGIFLTSGSINIASAGKNESVQQKQSKSNFNSSTSHRTKKRVKKVSISKARKALRKTKKNSLARRSTKHRTKHVAVRRYRGLHPRLSRLLSLVKRHYGRPIAISSGCRSHRHNRRIGGAKRSMHLRCMAADFKVAGVSKASLRRFVSRLPGRGGVGTYCGRSIVHLDVGPRRSWHQGCSKRRRRRG